MAEIEVASAFHAANGTVRFVAETDKPAADLEVTLDGVRTVVEITSLRESQERKRIDDVYRVLFDRCIVRRGFGGQLWYGGRVLRPPSHAEFRDYETKLDDVIARALKDKAHQFLKIGDWLDITIAVPGVEPVPSGLGTVETLTPEKQSLDVLLARAVRGKAKQLGSNSTGGVLLVVDSSRHFPDAGAFTEADLTRTAKALTDTPQVRGILYALPSLSGPSESELRIDEEGPKRMYHLRPIRVAIGALGTVRREPSDEPLLRSMVDAIMQLEKRLDRLPPIG